ncbi:hypothetical protein [Streptacidiphilus sp. MAP5-3]|uniref:hypothetical protein n=1 Tax=unclassified Streptacidiphilus TaxID=2643834 RepID=UPI0035134C0B
MSETEPPVQVGLFGDDHQFRLVSFRGAHHVPMTRREFEERMGEDYPGEDPYSADLVVWLDHPGEWPGE